MDAALLQQTSDMQRTFDAAPLNALANHPRVRPSCGGDGCSELDFAPFVANRDNHALVWDGGAVLWHWSAPFTYEAHVMVLPQGRGRRAYAMAQEAVDYILAAGAERLWARIGVDANALRHFAATAGFARIGSNSLDIGFGPVAYDLYQWKKPCLQQS